jgi:Holliday junction resolvase RusA-like endonuclease
MSLARQGRGKYVKKKELLEAIRSRAGKAKVEKAKSEFKGRKVGVEVKFRLWKGDVHHPESVGKKDLDNLLKGVLDVLQVSVDKQGMMEGLGIVETDDSVFRIVATKELVNEISERGLTLTILALT